ncbi:phage integrase [Mycobacteroides abscessus subsp. abscessus]|nr:phage integrase [Mycobacteroides abscessus subsp. abscessus]SHS53412.1 phage integrase [Mycobacteroides abscessus subsp. abscessus]SHS85584.1 phage integrase [Mycobacteroides abscessus subsp. abscessus]SHT06259.1 phage integrase [Mycobacteroides abscessus subsp. abscessus]SHT83130.1 phage integrase [Mycobacteroides abscessus subsp. abscessus]
MWLARCRFRDSDGVTRIVERRGPEGDQRGKGAEDVLMEALATRRPPGSADEITLDSKVIDLVNAHIDRLEEDGRASRTVDTYRYASSKLSKFLGGVRVSEATPARCDAAIRSMKTAHGPTMARQSRTIMKGGLQLAVMAAVLGANPVRDVSPINARESTKGAAGLTREQLKALLSNIRESEYCQSRDLADPIVVFIATGLRRSELLGLRWADFNEKQRTLTVTGKVVRVAGKGLVRFDGAKTKLSRRTVSLPKFAVEALSRRRQVPFLGERDVIFASSTGTLRDPDNFGAQWRKVRDDLGVADVTSHSFRKSIGTLIDEDGMSARVGADQLGHSKVSMTQDRYMVRGRVHKEVAEMLDRELGISDE